ncbi:23954_t:CDS:1, partial [Entrophospora sp. SA101]
DQEKASKYSIEIQLLQKDLNILSKKLKESNSQLEESHEKQARLQQELDVCNLLLL